MQMPSPVLSLPDELRKFLHARRPLKYDPKECECGKVTLLRPRQLRLQQYTIYTSEMQEVWGDPHRGKGCYLVPAVNLVASCEHYDPEAILIWIPKLKMFGSWDCDHHVIKVLTARHVRGNSAYIEAALWEDIVAEPSRYLSAAWGRDQTISKLLVPWPKFRWVART
jgi:hypothetical protein